MIESVTLILEVSIILLVLSNLFDKHLKMDIYTVSVIMAYLFIFEAINIGDLPRYLSFLAYVVIFVYSLFKFRGSIKVTILNFLLSFVIGSLLQLIFCIPVYYFLKRESDIVGLNSLLVNFAGIIAVTLLVYKVRLIKLSDFIQKRSWIIKISFVFITTYLFVNFLYMQKNDVVENKDLIQIIFFAVLFFLAVNEWQKAIADAERKKTQLEMNRLYYDAYDELILLIRERQHDMKNHINAILGMIHTIDNYEDLVESQKRYCDDVVEKSKETKLLLSIGNPLVAGFLYRKFQEAQKMNISIECKVASKDNNYFIPEYELIEMLGVLLDNAIEALEVNEELDKKIYIEIGDREKEFSILIANNSRVYGPNEICKFFQKDFTSKGKGHGIGLTKLKKMVQKREGDIIVTNENINGYNYLQFCAVMPKNG